MKLLAFALMMTSIVGCFKTKDLGTKDNPIKLYFTPSIDGGIILQNSQKFIKFLEKETGFFYKSGIPTNYISVVEAFGSKRADIGLMNSFGYLLANRKYGANAKLKVIRHGKDYYRGQIIAHIDSKIKTIKDIDGKRFAFTDSSSTSGYIMPYKILKDHKVKLKNSVFALKHDNVVTMIYQKQVDAGATFYGPPTSDGKIQDARFLVKTQFPDVEDKIKIIKITDKIPNDPFVFRKGLPKHIADSFISALKKFLTTKEGRKVFKTIYNVSGVIEAKDSDYNDLRQMVRSTNLDLGKMVK